MNIQPILSFREDYMVLKKTSILILFTILMLASAQSYTQEAKWRVLSTVDTKIVPNYEEYVSPFPYKPKPVTRPSQRVVKKVLPIEQELILQRKIADLVNNIRTLMQSNSFAKPDLSALKARVKGIITGENSSSVLLGNSWYKTGFTVDVPRLHVVETQRLIRDLAQLDEEVAKPLIVQLNDTIGDLQKLSLTLVSINNDYIVMETTTGEKFSLDMSSKHSN